MLILAGMNFSFAQENELTQEEQEFLEFVIADSISGQTGAVNLSTAHCTLNVPDGFVFLNKTDSRHLLVDYWENPEDRLEGVLGTMVKADAGIFYNVETAYVITYDNCGYVSTKDANSINYTDLMADMKKQVKEENRKKQPGEQKWELLGWGWQPYYDKQKKVLCWALHYKVDDAEVINYDVRVLGKDGFVVIKAVSSPDLRKELIADNEAIIGSIEYNPGYTYADFNPKTDHVAEWTIGGLIAGKVLAKAGVWAFLTKFSKIIILAIIGFLAAIRKKIARWLGFAKEEDEEDEDILQVD